MDINELLALALRISIMYLYALTLLRLSGKRSIGDLSTLDFVVATIIGDMFDDVIWSEIPLSQGLVGLTTIILLHTLLGVLQWRYKTIHDIVSSVKTLVVKDGRQVKGGMRKERMTKEILQSDLRMNGEEDMSEVHEAYLEPGGEISVLKKEQNKPVQKKDLRLLEMLFR